MKGSVRKVGKARIAAAKKRAAAKGGSGKNSTSWGLPSVPKLTSAEIQRYVRHFIVDEWGGGEGQLKLKKAKVLVLGVGGAGAALVSSLACAGVGAMRICDGGSVQDGCLSAQSIHDESQIGMKRALSAAAFVERMNSNIKVVPYPVCFGDDNIAAMAEGCDIICASTGDPVDAQIISRYTMEHPVPVVWAHEFYMGGFLSVVEPPKTICLDCVLAACAEEKKRFMLGKFPESDGMPIEGITLDPIIGPAAAAAGSMQAMEVLKRIVGFGPILLNAMLKFQLGGYDRIIEVLDAEPLRRPDCPFCGVSSRA